MQNFYLTPHCFRHWWSTQLRPDFWPSPASTQSRGSAIFFRDYFFRAASTLMQSPWLHLEGFLCNSHLLCFCGSNNQTEPSAPLSLHPKVNMDLSSLLDSEDKKSKNKRGVLPKHATNIMRSWLFQHLMVRLCRSWWECVTDWGSLINTLINKKPQQRNRFLMI